MIMYRTYRSPPIFALLLLGAWDKAEEPPSAAPTATATGQALRLGAAIAHSRHELEGKILDDSVSRAAAATEKFLMQSAGPATLDVTAPLRITSRKWGAVRIGYSLAEMQQKVAAVRHLVLFAGMLAVLAAAAAASFIAWRITRRLHALQRGTEIIGAGHLDYRLTDPVDDEIGRVASAFNTMAGHLQADYRWVRGHHEPFDGTGHPDGLVGEDIPFQARILAVADAFDSMTAERPYRTTPGRARALKEIKRHAGTGFDPRVVEACLQIEASPASASDENNACNERSTGRKTP